jgi:hypothetical protein
MSDVWLPEEAKADWRQWSDEAAALPQGPCGALLSIRYAIEGRHGDAMYWSAEDDAEAERQAALPIDAWIAGVERLEGRFDR